MRETNEFIFLLIKVVFHFASSVFFATPYPNNSQLQLHIELDVDLLEERSVLSKKKKWKQ